MGTWGFLPSGGSTIEGRGGVSSARGSDASQPRDGEASWLASLGGFAAAAGGGRGQRRQSETCLKEEERQSAGFGASNPAPGSRRGGIASSLLRLKLDSQDSTTSRAGGEPQVFKGEGLVHRQPTPKGLVAAANDSHCSSSERKLGPGDFEILAVVGHGSFGKVFQVKKKDTGKIYAMKVMRKEKIYEKDHVKYVLSEKNVLTEIDHPYIVRIFYSFQTSKKLYLVLDFISGGHLFYQLFQLGTFPEDKARMHIAEIVSAIAFLHNKGILHRDLKPENVLLDEDGHIKVTDFGLCKAKMDDDATRADSFVGTVQYMAPEIIKGEQHTRAVDWWSVGILLYEMLSGNPPFDFKTKKGDVSPKDRDQLMKRILGAKLQRPKFCSKSAWSLVRSLLTRDPHRRLGSKCSNDVKNHTFFWMIDWDSLDKRELVSPFKPSTLDVKSVAYFEGSRRDLLAVDSPCGTPDCPGILGAFQGYSYQAPSTLEQGMGRVDSF